MLYSLYSEYNMFLEDIIDKRYLLYSEGVKD